MSVGRTDLGTRIGLVLAITQITVSLILTPRFGAMGNAIALLSIYVFGQPALAYFVIKEISRSPGCNVTIPTPAPLAKL